MANGNGGGGLGAVRGGTAGVGRAIRGGQRAVPTRQASGNVAMVFAECPNGCAVASAQVRRRVSDAFSAVGIRAVRAASRTIDRSRVATRSRDGAARAWRWSDVGGQTVGPGWACRGRGGGPGGATGWCPGRRADGGRLGDEYRRPGQSSPATSRAAGLVA